MQPAGFSTTICNRHPFLRSYMIKYISMMSLSNYWKNWIGRFLTNKLARVILVLFYFIIVLPFGVGLGYSLTSSIWNQLPSGCQKRVTRIPWMMREGCINANSRDLLFLSWCRGCIVGRWIAGCGSGRRTFHAQETWLILSRSRRQFLFKQSRCSE